MTINDYGGEVMGIFDRFRRKHIAAVAKEIPNQEEMAKRRVELKLIVTMRQRIQSYPHSYFIRKGPKHFAFKG